MHFNRRLFPTVTLTTYGRHEPSEMSWTIRLAGLVHLQGLLFGNRGGNREKFVVLLIFFDPMDIWGFFNIVAVEFTLPCLVARSFSADERRGRFCDLPVKDLTWVYFLCFDFRIALQRLRRRQVYAC